MSKPDSPTEERGHATSRGPFSIPSGPRSGRAAAGLLVEAQVEVRHIGCAVSESLTDGAFAAQISSDRCWDLLVMNGPTAADVERFLEAIQATQRKPPHILTRTERSVVLRGRNPEEGVVAAINRSRCATLWPAVWSMGVERYVVLAPDRPDLDELLAMLAPLGTVRLTRVAEADPVSLPVSVSLATLTDGFTQRQLETLLLAIRSGYYERPRRVDTKHLGDLMGLARTTLEEHLRKAERRALERFAQAITAHPELVRLTGRRGRPPKRRAAGP